MFEDRMSKRNLDEIELYDLPSGLNSNVLVLLDDIDLDKIEEASRNINVYIYTSKLRGEIPTYIKESIVEGIKMQLSKYCTHLDIAKWARTKRKALYLLGTLGALEIGAFFSWLGESLIFLGLYENYLNIYLGIINTAIFFGGFIAFPIVGAFVIPKLLLMSRYEKRKNKIERILTDSKFYVKETYDKNMEEIHSIYKDTYNQSIDQTFEKLIRYVENSDMKDKEKIIEYFKKFTKDGIYSTEDFGMLSTYLGIREEGGIKKKVKKFFNYLKNIFSYTYGLPRKLSISYSIESCQ
ncbi:MAG: hypothetical protein QXG91_00190 [Candidatus Aenigmatarchaeota archaeon]